MFYTKYRPQKFSEISKPNDAAAALMNQVRLGKVSHAYLFVGPRGTGKTTTARILAKALNCGNVDEYGDPCGKCDVCVAIRNGSFLDLIEIDAASNRGIDDIRDLRDKIKLAPAAGKQKVYIIDEVHMLTTEAFNALLKTLEEPPAHAKFILCTTEDHKVPDTIKSRCQVFKFRRADVKQIVEKLESICKTEKAKITKDQLKKIAEASFGGFRDAETLLQQVIEGGIDPDAFVGLSSKQVYVDFVNSLLAFDANSAIKQINKYYENGVDLYVWTQELLRYLRDLLFIVSCGGGEVVDATKEIMAKMEEQAGKFEPADIVKMIEVFVKAQNAIKNSPIAQLPLELAIVIMCDNSDRLPKSDFEDKNGPSSTKRSTRQDITNGRELKSSAKEISGAALDNNIDLSVIEEKWNEILKKATVYNHSIHALLKSCKPVKVENEGLVLEALYAFHKERLETVKNRSIVEKVFAEVLPIPIKLKRVLISANKPLSKGKETGELTDYNVQVPSDVSVDKATLEVFDGGLSL